MRVPASSVDTIPATAGIPEERPPRRLRRLHRVWPDRDGKISYLLTMCVDGRAHILDNEPTFERLVSFLLDSPTRYFWFGRRFVVMPDHIHLIAHQGHDAIRLGQWIKAFKAVVGGLKPREGRPVRSSCVQDATPKATSGDAAPSVTEVAAAYLLYLCRNPPFVDGNKRTALAACKVFLRLNGIHEARLLSPTLSSTEWRRGSFLAVSGCA